MSPGRSQSRHKPRPMLVLGFLGSLSVLASMLLFSFQKMRGLLGNMDYIVFTFLFALLSLSIILALFVTAFSDVGSNAKTTVIACVFLVAFFSTLQIYPQANESSVVGWDSYYNARVATDISALGRLVPSTYAAHFTQDYLLKWPGFPVLMSETSAIVGRQVLELSRYLPTFINVPTVLIALAITRKIGSRAEEAVIV
ncbi:hypothetical protein MUP59_00675, partial [Candidatus Bathyarchaeota archaeon]|nr:hypothetical protein [Candidatus Bathyarchaeota archaeon]